MTEEEARELFDAFMNWKSEGLTNLFHVEGYSEAMLSGLFGELTEEQRRLLESMHRASEHTIAHWDQFSSFIRFRYGFFDVKTWTELSISELIASTQATLRTNILFEEAEVDLPENLPLIYGDRAYLSAALEYLLSPSGYYAQSATEVTEIYAQSIENSMVALRIDTNLRLNAEELQKPLHLFYPGTPPVTAALIIQQHGGQVEKQPLAAGTRFIVTLPVWKGH